MIFSEMVSRAKIWVQQTFTGKQPRPKVPRKKLQIQFTHSLKQFHSQVGLLTQALASPELSASARLLGNHLLEEAQRFQERHLIEINDHRLSTRPDPLVHPVDFSMWVQYQLYSYTEEIYHYLKTIEVPPQ